MADQRLIDYIKNELNSGFSKESIRDVLIKNGWPKGMIDEAFYIVENQSNEIGMKTKSKADKSKKLALISVIVIILVSLYFIFISPLFLQTEANQSSVSPSQGISGLPPKFSPKTKAFDSFSDFLKNLMVYDYVSLLNKSSTAEELKQAKIAALGQIYASLANDKGVKGLCEKGLNTDLDPIVSSVATTSVCKDFDCIVEESIKTIRSTIAIYRNNMDACTDGVEYADKGMARTELENYFNYLENFIEYIKNMQINQK